MRWTCDEEHVAFLQASMNREMRMLAKDAYGGALDCPIAVPP